MHRAWRDALVVSAAVLAAGASPGAADTLVLRSGRDVEGTLIEVRGDWVRFEDERGRELEYEREDVRRIELDRYSYGRGRRDAEQRHTGPSAGMRERSVAVVANQPWTDTGIDVRAGQTVYFSASGKVRWGPNRKHGPAGEGGRHTNPNRPIPDRPGAALIGRVGEKGGVFFVGDDEGPVRIRASGTLYLGINDDYLRDNSGRFDVKIYY